MTNYIADEELNKIDGRIAELESICRHLQEQLLALYETKEKLLLTRLNIYESNKEVK